MKALTLEKAGQAIETRKQRANWRHAVFFQAKKILWVTVRTILVSGICFLILYPLAAKLSVSVMAERDLYDITVCYVPKHFTWDNYRIVWRYMGLPGTFFNSFWLSFTTGVLQVISCTLVGYGFARFDFPFKKLFFGLVVVMLVVPPSTIMVPLFLRFRFFDLFGLIKLISGNTINLIDTFWPFVLTSITGTGLRNGLYIYMMRQFFRGSPKELEESAYVDGAGPYKTFYYIMLPVAVPMMVTVFLFSFVWQWTDTFYTTLFLEKLMTLPTILSSLAVSINYQEFGSMATLSPAYASMLNNTGSVLVILPLIVIYLIAQRYFVESIQRSGLIG